MTIILFSYNTVEPCGGLYDTLTMLCVDHGIKNVDRQDEDIKRPIPLGRCPVSSYDLQVMWQT